MYTAFAATVFLSARQEEVFGQKFCLERRPYEPWGRQLARKSPVQPPLHSLPASALLLMRAVASPQAGVVVRDRAEVRCWYPNHKNSHPWEPFFRPRGHPRSYCRATERDRSFPESNGLPRDVQVLRSHATEAPAALSACQDKPASSGRHQPSACGDGNAYGHGGSIKGSAAVQPLDLPPQSIPKHIAIIMDGNARWASRRGREAQFGHQSGVRALRRVVECCSAWGIEALTVYAFSAENWGRDAAETNFLMQLMTRVIKRDTPELAAQGVRMRFIGELEGLPRQLQNQIARAEAETAGCARLQLSIAINYSSRRSLAAAARRLAEEAAAGRLDPSDIDEAAVDEQLSRGSGERGGSRPPPLDLVVRTSGERRLSNFLLWEAAYAELYFTETLWPDFGEEDLRAAVADFSARQRRFGSR